MTKLNKAIEEALKLDPRIVCDISRVNETQPYTEEYLGFLGLTRNMLKKLERHGLAARRYTKNAWLQGETLPSGKVVEEGKRYHGKGTRLAWILIAPKGIENHGREKAQDVSDALSHK